jgi:hypothetical protein
MSADPRLINAYKKARDMITETPDNKENIINAYIDLVEKINNYYNGGGSLSSRDNGGGLASMLKNPLEIEIYNNFQRYGASSSIPLSAITSQQQQQDGPVQHQLSYQEGADTLLNLANYS